jgi:Bacterial protein of unknown function (DUF885)
MNIESRLRALCDLMVSEVREYVGLHAYDGVVQDLSPDGVRAGLARLGADGVDGAGGAEAATAAAGTAGGAGLGPVTGGPDDTDYLAAFEARLRVDYGEVEMHRRSPLVHLDALDLSCYDREYAPAGQREAARRRHIAGWPGAVDAALASLDRLSAPVARALLPAVEGLGAGLPAGDGDDLRAARAAHARLVEHVRRAVDSGERDPALGAPTLARMLSTGEAIEVDLGRLEEIADAERDRLRERLDDACARLARDGRDAPRQATTAEVVRGLLADHPEADEVLDEARSLVAETIAFTRERDLLPVLDGECEVLPAPPSRRWAMAMMSWAAPFEDDAPSRYYIVPPDPSWPVEEQAAWLEVFNRASLPAITAHEVAPGHFAHGRALRQAPTAVRRTLQSTAFIEGWAHYTEELCVEEGFRAEDPRYEIGVWLEALIRVTRLAAALGVHRRTMTVDEAVARFTNDAFLAGVAAEHEAWRATYDPTYGRYTWGKLEILRLRDAAKARWGTGYSHRRFHGQLLALGAPPLGLMGAAVD